MPSEKIKMKLGIIGETALDYSLMLSNLRFQTMIIHHLEIDLVYTDKPIHQSKIIIKSLNDILLFNIDDVMADLS